ncbi:ABC transporter permease [Mycoplasma testudineum]|uniref:ABC transporter permease n=1 Tax=Mycoplasma testudineum TaxID=244584 RepID=UPI00146AD970|nr:ABC transporter permease [Mycoplasma testudineum]
MRRLFKEIFRSLRKSKVLIIGLSILVFLSSAIFTLLFDVRTAYENRLDSYNTVSKMQDLTVDLSVESDGKIPSNGAFIETKESYDIAQLKKDGKFANFNSKYILAQTFFPTAEANQYILASSIEDLYNGKTSRPTIIIDKEKDTITFNSNDLDFQLYSKDVDSYNPLSRTNTIDSNTVFKFDKETFLNHIARINPSNDGRAFLSNLGELYLNIVTKEATSSSVKAFEWKKRNELYTVEGQNLATLLGFTKNESTSFYNYDSTITPQIKLDPAIQNGNAVVISYGAKMSGEFRLSFLNERVLNIDSNLYLEPQIGFNYVFSNQFIQKQTIIYEFVLNQFKLNYDENADPQTWSGNYLQALKELLNDPNFKDQISEFSYWSKTQKIYFDDATEPSITSNVVLTRQDMEIPFQRNNATVTVASISNIADPEFISVDEYNALLDNDIASKRLKLITNRAQGITQKDLVNKVINTLGTENVGIRQTTVVNSVNNETNKTTVFNFVNTGDMNYAINSVVQNVGKLYNETIEPTKINSLTSNNDDFFRSEILTPKIAALIAGRVLQNYALDSNYLKTNIEYENVLIPESDGSFSRRPNQKIVTVRELNSPITKDKGFTVINELYYFVNKNSTGEWILADDKGMTFKDLGSYFQSNNFTVDSTKTNTTWARPDTSQSDRIVLPLVARVPNPEILNEILTKGTFTIISDNVAQLIRESALYSQGIFTENFLNIFIQSVALSAYENDLHKLLSVGKANANVFPKFYLDIIYHMNNQFGASTFQDFIVNIINRFKELTIESGTTLEQRKEYFKTQISNLTEVFKSFGTDLLSILPFNLTLDDIMNFTNDPIIIFEALVKIVRSFDVNEAINEIRMWYSENWQKTVDEKKNLISDFNFLVPFFKYADESMLKEGLLELISIVNFRALLNPNEPTSIYRKIVNSKGKEDEQLKLLFTKIDSNNGTYSNIYEGLKELISLFNLNLFITNLESKAKWFDYKQENDERNFRYYGVTTSDLLASFIESLTKSSTSSTVSNNDIAVKLALIKMLNLSDSGEFNDIVGYIPLFENDPKLGLSSLSILTSLSESDNDIISELKKIQNNIKNGTLSISEIAYLKSKFSMIENYSASNYPEINSYIDAYLSLYDEFSFNPNVNNLATITNLLLGTVADDEIYRQARSQISAANPFEVTNPDGSINYNYGKSLINAISFLIKIKTSAASNSSFLSDYRKIFELFNNKTTINNRIVFDAEFLNQLNSKILYPDQSANIDLGEFNINKGLAATRRMTSELFNNENSSLQSFISSLSLDSQKTINDSRLNFVFFMSAFASLVEYNSSVLKVFDPNATQSKSFINIFNSESSLWSRNSKVVEILNSITDSVIQTDKLLSSIDLSPALLSPLLNVILPQVTLWFTSDVAIKKDATEEEKINRSNLAYILTEKIRKFNQMTSEEVSELSTFIVGNSLFSSPAETDDVSNILLDIDFFEKNGISPNTDPNLPTFYGIELKSFIYKALGTITYLQRFDQLIYFDDAGSYVAKVNDAFLRNNNYSVYTGEIPSNVIDFQNWMNANQNQKFILDISGTKFIIIGTETTADYIYPVVDENNIQVDTATQGIVYVNQMGFDRVKSFASGPVKTYVLAQNKTNQNTNEIVNQLNEYIYQNTGKNTIQKAYSSMVTDPLNPERALRIRAPLTTIRTISNFNLYTLIILVVLVSIAFSFVVKRYIQNKAKVLGILISQGYTPIQISISLTAFALVTAVLGGFTGYLTGNLLQRYVINLFSNYWSVPTGTTGFSPISLFFTIVLPWLGMSVLIILVTLLVLRTKSIDLMSGASDIKVNALTTWLSQVFRKRDVKTKFNVSLLVSSFWKLIWLMLAFVLSSTVILFSISSNNVFSKAANETYANRNYNYNIDLVTPTSESGLILPTDGTGIANQLYSPVGNSAEAQLEYNNYFAPGYSLPVQGERLANGSVNAINNGNPTDLDPKVVTRFGADINVDLGIKINPWELTYNDLPDTIKNRIDKITNNIAPQLEKVQYDEDSQYKLIVEDINEYYGNSENPLNYFKYYENLNGINGFFLNRWNPIEKRYIPEPITTSSTYLNPEGQRVKVRDAYREFLVNAYTKLAKANPLNLDFLITFNGVIFNPDYDETYTYIRSKIGNNEIKILGYKENTNIVDFVNFEGKSMKQDLFNFETNDDIYPLIVNVVSAAKHGLSVGSELEISILNPADRYKKVILGNSEIDSYKFRVIGINQTFINDEFITTQNVANKLTKLDTLAKGDLVPFNGILSNRVSPDQITASSSLYSPSGYFSAQTGFNFDNPLQSFDYIFGENGTLQTKVGLTEEQILKWLNFSNYTSVKQITASRNDMNVALEKYAALYENQLYVSTITGLNSQAIESGFTTNLTSLINGVLNNIIAASIVISVVILVIITNIMINENEKNIALFSILGYTNKEKIRLFFSVFVPFIIGAIIISVFITIAGINIFNSYLISASSLALPLTIVWWHVLITIVAISLIFLVAASLSWLWINKIKPIMIMKGG